MGENPNSVSAGEVTSRITLVQPVLPGASSHGSGATCQLLSERTLPPGSCGVVFKAWETGPRRGRLGPARPRHLVSATCGQESTQPGPGASASRGSAPVALPGGTPGLMGAAGALP